MKKISKKILLIAPLMTLTFATACHQTPYVPPVDPIVENENPILQIETENQQEITSKEDYLNATFTISNCPDEQKLDKVTGKIRGRGSSSWSMDKKSYRIKFDEKTSVVGSSYAAKNWVIIANYLDGTLYRNYVAYKLSSYLEDISFSPFIKQVDVYINNKYYGMYLITDKIEVSKKRINIDESIAEDGNNGYLLEHTSPTRAESEGCVENFDFISYTEDVTFQIKSPDVESEAYIASYETEISYIKDYMDKCLDALDNGTWEDIIKLIDPNSFADGYIIEELFANLDCYRYSMFYYKDKDDVLRHGPVWDFDRGAGNVAYGPGTIESCPPDKDLWAGKMNVFYIGLLKHDEFKQIVKAKMVKLKPYFQAEMELLNPDNEESYYLKHFESLKHNFAKWPMNNFWRRKSLPKDVLDLLTVYEQMSFLKNWLEKRFAYMETIYK